MAIKILISGYDENDSFSKSVLGIGYKVDKVDDLELEDLNELITENVKEKSKKPILNGTYMAVDTEMLAYVSENDAKFVLDNEIDRLNIKTTGGFRAVMH